MSLTERGEMEWAEDLVEVAVITLLVVLGLVVLCVMALKDGARRL